MMYPDPTATLRAEAIAWRIRLSDGTAQDWDDFASWLQRDPHHATAYDSVALNDLALDAALSEWSQSAAATLNDNEPATAQFRSTRRWMAAGAGVTGLAAAAAALLVLTPQAPATSNFYVVTTVPGEQKALILGGRYRIVLNGMTRIRLDRANPRFVSLITGEAAFAIVHDPAHPFSVELGTDRLLDVGTAFNVTRSNAGHRVQVAEGAVLYNPGREQISLSAGQTLTSKTNERRIIIGRSPVSQIGGWQHGRLSYRSAPLADVVADVSRSIGTPITVQSTIAKRAFTGTIEIDRNESRMLARLESLLGVAARRDAHGWTLGESGQNRR
jgi:transmembrane sensor